MNNLYRVYEVSSIAINQMVANLEEDVRDNVNILKCSGNKSDFRVTFRIRQVNANIMRIFFLFCGSKFCFADVRKKKLNRS